MANKKKDYNVTEQINPFFSQPVAEHEAEPVPPVEPEVKSQKRRVNPGKMWRVNLLLDAELQEPVILQALREKKNISVFVNDILKSYLEEHLQK